MPITAAEVTRRIKTALTTPEVDALISDATSWVTGWLDDHGKDISEEASTPESVREATILYAMVLIYDRDASANLKFEAVREGPAQVKFAGNSWGARMALVESAKENLERYLLGERRRKTPRISTYSHDPSENPFSDYVNYLG